MVYILFGFGSKSGAIAIPNEQKISQKAPKVFFSKIKAPESSLTSQRFSSLKPRLLKALKAP
jgi:hypothetical protein